MYNKTELQRHVIQTKTLQEVKSDTVRDPNLPHFNNSNLLMLLGPLGFITGWTILFLMLSKIGIAARDEIFFTIKRFQRVPCRNCQYFSNNPYLKCAVNPGAVLTEEALKCSEYQLTKTNKDLDEEE